MYYPKQIPYLLDQEFQTYLHYEEYHRKALESMCMCIWSITSYQPLKHRIYNYILPDACIDLVIDFTNRMICFAGYSKETEAFELHKDIDYMGVRFKPGAFYVLFQVPVDKIMDQMVQFSSIEQEISLDDLFDLDNTQARIDRLETYLSQKMKHVQKDDFMFIIERLYEQPRDQKVLEIASKFGYEQRHLMRLFKQHYGVSAKVLLNILRLHLCLTLLLEESLSLTDIAEICGFYDQSHFIKEIKRYTNVSPIQLLKNYAV